MFSMALPACQDDKGLQERMAKKKAEENARRQAEAEKKANAEAAKIKAAELADKKKEEDRKKRLAAMPPGNLAGDADVAQTEDEKAMLSELAQAERFMKIAKRLKPKQAQWTPFLLRALGHQNENVRTQAARVLVVNKVKSDAVTKAWVAALSREASNVVLENWAYDLRLYKDEAALPALHNAFKIASSPGSRGNLAETLMAFAYEPSRADIRSRLVETEDIMERVYLISALKRQPRGMDRAAVSKYVNHENSLLSTKATECVKAIDEAAKAKK